MSEQAKVKSELLSKEDYWAIWIGSFLLIISLFLFFASSGKLVEEIDDLEKIVALETTDKSYKSVEWYDANDQLGEKKGSSLRVGKFLKKLTTKPNTWDRNPVSAFYKSAVSASSQKELVEKDYRQSLKRVALAKQDAIDIQESSGDDEELQLAIANWRDTLEKLNSLRKKRDVSAFNKIPWLVGLMILMGSIFGFGSKVMGTGFMKFFKGFIYVFLIGLLAYLLGAQANMKAIGFGYAAWAIIIGLLISNTVGTPKWVLPALSTEFYIKTGLVILGAEILLSKILAIGLPGIFVAWIVTPIVLVTTYWFGQKVLKISSKTLNMTVSADMSVCGVSAAVATAAACKASKEELTVAIGLSMIFTSVMMIVMPAFINYMGMPEVLGGAWIGGTIDATGAVVAAGAFLGEKALSVAATIKMIQNVLIGAIAFGVAVYFALKVEKTGDVRVGKGEIWKRFPKFILGFLGASVIFSIIYVMLGSNLAYSLIDQGVIGAFSKNIRGWLFCLAFVSIGLSINFKELKKHFTGGKPFVLYICGQSLNLCFTLLMAYIMFYHVFPQITESI